MFILDELIDDLEQNTKYLLGKYNFDFDKSLKKFTIDKNEIRYKNYVVRDISFTLNINTSNLSNDYHIIIEPHKKLNLNISDLPYALYTLPFKYKVYRDSLELYDIFNNEVYYYSENEYGFTVINNNTINIKIPIAQYIPLSFNEFIGIKQLTLANNQQLFKFITYNDLSNLDIKHIIFEYQSTTNAKFRYLTNFYLKDELVDQYFNYDLIQLTPLVHSLHLKKKYISPDQKYRENNYLYFLINYDTSIKRIKNYRPLYSLDLEIFCNYHIINTEKIFIKLLTAPKNVNKIKVYDTDFIYQVNNNFVNGFNQNILNIKLLDLHNILVNE